MDFTKIWSMVFPKLEARRKQNERLRDELKVLDKIKEGIRLKTSNAQKARVGPPEDNHTN